jgi:TIR domain
MHHRKGRDEMADIFISYAREDTETATRLAIELEARGWSVFWDRRIPAGQRFAEFISEQLAGAGCVIALWSRAANASDWVQEEAEEARKRSVLVPAFIERVDPPWGFRRIQAADLVDWKGQAVHEGFQQLLEDVGQYAPPHIPLTEKLPEIKSPEIPSATLKPEQVPEAPQPPKKAEAGREAAEAQRAARETDEKEQLRAQQSVAATGAAVRLSPERAGQAKIESTGVEPDHLRQDQAAEEVRASEPERATLWRTDEARKAKQAEIPVADEERRPGIHSNLNSRILLAAAAAVILAACIFWLIRQHNASIALDRIAAQKAENTVALLGLVLARVNDGQIEGLVGQFGVNFNPGPEYLDTLRRAGAGDTLIKAIASARRFDVKSDEPASRTRMLHLLEEIARLLSESDVSKTGTVPDKVWTHLETARAIDPQDTILGLVAARMLGLSTKCVAPDRQTVALQVSGEDGEDLKINSEPVRQEQLQNRLENIYKTRAERILFLEFAPMTPVPQILQVFETARGAGIDKIPLIYSDEHKLECKK